MYLGGKMVRTLADALTEGNSPFAAITDRRRLVEYAYPVMWELLKGL
jgi:hypothetical protein